MAQQQSITGELSIRRQTPTLWTVGQLDGHTVVGVLPSGVGDGDFITVHGRFEQHQTYGKQFKFNRCESSLPAGLSGVRRYLARYFKWIGPKTAEAILKLFGADFFRVLDEEPQRLTEVRGITQKRADEIIERWQTLKEDREVDEFFAGCSISPAMQSRIYAALIPDYEQFARLSDVPREERLAVIRLIKENPYLLIEDVVGINFVRADSIARYLGFDFNSDYRVRACLLHLLHEAAAVEGHCYLPGRQLINDATALLSAEPSVIKQQAQKLIDDGKIVIGHSGGSVYLKKFKEIEKRLAERIKALAVVERDRSFDRKSKQWDWLTDKQGEALAIAMSCNLMVLTGLLGSGKSTSLKAIVEAFGKDVTIELAAPTGKAAKRMTQQIGRSARTIHRLLQYHPEFGFRVNKDNPIDADVVILDEGSMIDIELADAMLDAIDPKHTQLILVGDVNQLPSVGPGRFLNDIIESEICPVIELTEILRQDEAGQIVHNAHRIHRGENLIATNDQDFYLAYVSEPGQIANTVLEILKTMPTRLGMSPLDFQVICRRRNR
jgi:exodeoxyribonuclease V alpha subunit